MPFRSEKADVTWRYAFYARGQAPQGQSDKLPCLSLPLAELPHEVLDGLTELFGDRFSGVLPVTGRDAAPGGEVGGEK